MKAIFLYIPLVFYSFLGLGQAQDEQRSINWLKKNLNYSYLNHEQGKWWLNKFELIIESGILHIQNASTENPAKMSGKSWIDRRVKLTQLDPYSISINPIYENKGRIVKGSVLIIHAMDHQKSIGKTIDARTASSESFLQFAIPNQLQETSPNFIDSLKFHLEQIIEWDSKTTKGMDLESNLESVFNVMTGRFLNNSVTRTYARLFNRTIEYEDKLGSKPIRKGFFGYDEIAGAFFETFVEQGIQKSYTYVLSGDERLELISKSDPSRKIIISSLLHFEIISESKPKNFRRISYD